MVTKVLEIDIDDSKFKEFSALFEKYQEQLAKQPAAWGKVNKEVSGVSDGFSAAAAAISGIDDAANSAVDKMAKFGKASESGAKGWKDIAKSTKSAAKDITGLVGSVLKIAGIGGIFGGLLGAGGLFGLSRLASSAASQSRSASGLNVSPGEQAAFKINYKNLVNPDTFLSGVSEAMQDPSKRSALYGAGLNESQLQGKDPAQVAAMLIPLLQKKLQNTPTNMRASVMGSFGLGQFGNLQDMNRLANADPKQIAIIQKQYEQDIKNLNLSKETNAQWIEFDKQLDRSKIELENTFITALTPLAPQLKELSSVFTGFIKDVAQSGMGGEVIKYIGEELGKFATFLKTWDYKKDLTEFADDIVLISKSVANGLKWLGIIPDHKLEEANKKSNNSQDLTVGQGASETWRRIRGGKVEDEPIYNPGAKSFGNKSSFATTYALLKKHGMGDAQAMGILANFSAESGLDPNAQEKGGQGYGLAQWGLSRQKDFAKFIGHDIHGSTADEQIRFLKHELMHGDYAKAGMKIARAHTAEEVARIMSQQVEKPLVDNSNYRANLASNISKNPSAFGITVNINNTTGGSAVASVNQSAGV